MRIRGWMMLVGLGCSAGLAQAVTLPVVFTKTVAAEHAHAGDVVLARTTEVATLPDGVVVPKGSSVAGHVVAANGFSYDTTPYAKQHASALTVQFDAVSVGGKVVPLHVTVRAMASPIAVNDASEAKSSDLDSLGTRTLVGGAQLVPSQDEIRNGEGDVVAYNRRDGVRAHLIASGACDGGSTEVAVDVFSPTACGLYGFGNVSQVYAAPAQLTLTSTHGSPQIWKYTMALLETLPEGLER